MQATEIGTSAIMSGSVKRGIYINISMFDTSKRHIWTYSEVYPPVFLHTTLRAWPSQRTPSTFPEHRCKTHTQRQYNVHKPESRRSHTHVRTCRESPAGSWAAGCCCPGRWSGVWWAGVCLAAGRYRWWWSPVEPYWSRYRRPACSDRYHESPRSCSTRPPDALKKGCKMTD